MLLFSFFHWVTRKVLRFISVDPVYPIIH